MKKLPKTPSKLIRLALKDLRKAERSEGFEIDMANWFESVPNRKTWRPKMDKKGVPVCSVCFGGAVMAGTLEMKRIEEGHMVSEVGTENIHAVLALDSFRVGGVTDGVRELFPFSSYEPIYGEKEKRQNARHRRLHDRAFEIEEALPKVPAYTKRTRLKFHKAMRLMANRLESAGL